MHRKNGRVFAFYISLMRHNLMVKVKRPTAYLFDMDLIDQFSLRIKRCYLLFGKRSLVR